MTLLELCLFELKAKLKKLNESNLWDCVLLYCDGLGVLVLVLEYLCLQYESRN